MIFFRCKLILNMKKYTPVWLTQEGGSVSKQTIGRVLTTSVTSRHISVFFEMALYVVFQKVWNFLRFG